MSFWCEEVPEEIADMEFDDNGESAITLLRIGVSMFIVVFAIAYYYLTK